MPLSFLEPGDTLDVAHILRQAIDANKAEMVLSTSDVVRLTDLEIRKKDGLAVLLFRRSDPMAAVPIFEHSRTRQLRKSDKSEDEGVAVSAHLFVHLTPFAGTEYPTYKAILEEMPSLGRTYIEHIIGDALRDYRYTYDDYGIDKETYSILELHGIKSEQLSDALKNSTIQHVTLTRPGSIEGMDSEGLVAPIEERFRLIIRAEPDKVLHVLGRIKEWMRGNDWKNMIVRVDMPEKRSRNVTVDREAGVADAFFVRSEQIDVKKALDNCSDIVSDELCAKAKTIFAQAGLE